jgi:SAM-dependent methyltransferase
MTQAPEHAPAVAPNAGQADYWNAEAGRTWVELQALLDMELQPLGDQARRALAPAAGEQVLDIGCGAGETSLELARAVGSGGRVLGVDLSEPLLGLARLRAADAGPEAGVAPVDFVQADAQTAAFAQGAFDAAYSRFGVMFFADPVAAFANIRAALRPGGRLAFVCWRPFADNPVMHEPLEAALPVIPPLEPGDPDAPGPFAFADPERVRGILGTAGFAQVRIAPFDVEVGGWTDDQALLLVQRVGPLGSILRQSPDLRAPVVEAVSRALARRRGADGRIRLGAAVWIVSAIRP